MLAGLLFLHRWYQGRQSFDAVIGIVGVAISIGTKLHVTFYLPLLLAIGVTLVIHYRAVLREGQNWLNFRGALVGAIVIPLAAIFSLSFIAYNYLSAGRATAWEFNNQLLNTPFNVHVALQTMVLYAAQIVLTPVADLHSNFNYARSAQYYEAFNHLFDRYLFGSIMVRLSRRPSIGLSESTPRQLPFTTTSAYLSASPGLSRSWLELGCSAIGRTRG